MVAKQTKVAEEHYIVVCRDCGQDFMPGIKTPLWWQAKQAADRGRLDAIECTGKQCGCIKPRNKPEAPFRIFGYTDLCEDFDIPCDTFMEAVKHYRKLNRFNIVFIEGISDKTRLKLDWL